MLLSFGIIGPQGEVSGLMFPGVFQAEKENWGGNGRLTLRMVARKVALLSCVIRTLMSIAERALGFRYWADQGQRYSTPTEQHLGEANSLDTDLTFDCSSFKSQYEFRLPARALCTASCPPAWRSEPDLCFLRSTLRTLPSFRRYSPHMQLKLAKVIRYERFGRGRVVVKRGQRGSSFYFVFSGIIAVTQDLDGSSAFTDQEPILMRKGAGFGEVALLKGLRRNATVVCVEDTELLVVDKEDFFSHQLDQELQKEALERYSFFRSLALFSSWPDAALETLADHCKTEQIHHDQVVLRDSSSTTSLIFITKGQCDVLRMVELSQCSSYHRWIRQQQALLDKTQGRTLTESGEIEKKVSLRPRDSPASSPASASHFQALFPEVDVLQESQVLGDWAIREQAFSLSDSGESGNPDKNSPLGQESSLRKEIVPSKGGAGTPSGLPREVEAGVYMRIDTLKHGQHFTAVDMGYIQSCLEREGKLPQERPLWATPAHCRDPRGMVIVSQGAEVIRVKLEKFSELTDWATLEKLMRADRPYPSDDQLSQVFLEQNRWRVFKSEVLSSVGREGTPNFPGLMRRRRRGGRRDAQRSSEWEINRRGLLFLTHPTSAQGKVWAAPCPQKELPTEETAPPRALRLIHAIAIPKISGKSRDY